jgi:L-fuconolactonase
MTAMDRPLRIDAHQHFWKYDPSEYGWISEELAVLKRDFLPADLKPLLEASGFDGCVAVQARQTLEESRWLLELADHADFIRGVVGWVDLCGPDLEAQLESLSRHPKFVGVRHVVQDEPDDRFMLREDFQRGIARLAGHGLTYDILIFPKQLPAACELAARFPEQRFVLDHIAKPPIASGGLSPWREGIESLARHPQVHCKLSGMATEADWGRWKIEDFRQWIDIVIDAFGPARLMIGSDWPVCTLSASHAEAMEIVTSALSRLSADERDGVLGGNAAAFYRLPKWGD